MNSRFLSATRLNITLKSFSHRVPFSFASSPTVKTTPHVQYSTPQTSPRERYFHTSLTRKENEVGERDKTFWQWYRASEPKDTILQIPTKMPYKKGKYVTDQITMPEAGQYLYPLFLRGWEIVEMAPEQGSEEAKASPYLASQVVLASEQEVEPIYAFLTLLQKQEKHHVLSNISPGPQPLLSIQSQTHSARKVLDGIPESEGYDLTEPGITLRDVRFAVLLEQEFLRRNAFFVPNRHVERDAENISQLLKTRKKEWESLMARYPWKQ